MIKIFSDDKSLAEGIKLTFFDALSILVASCLGALLTWVSYNEDAWLPLWAYLLSVLLMVFGLYVSKRLGSGKLSYLINVMVVASLCIMATVNLTQCLAEILRLYVYGGEYETKFVEKYATGRSVLEDLGWTILPIISVVLANRWMDVSSAKLKNNEQRKKSCLIDVACRFLLGMIGSKISHLMLLGLVSVSFYFGQKTDDMSIFAASGALLTIFGLFSIIKFTTIEKYLKQDEIVYGSTGVTGPPLTDEQYEEVVRVNRNKARARLSQELRSELVGVLMTVVGTVIWAYGGYLPATYF